MFCFGEFAYVKENINFKNNQLLKNQIIHFITIKPV